LEYRQIAENKLCSDIKRLTTCECLKATNVFFQGEEHSAGEIRQRLAELHIDGILIIQTMGSGERSAILPQVTETRGSANIYGDNISGNSTSMTYGGNMIFPWMTFEARLSTIPSGKVIWYASAKTEGGSATGPDILIESVSGTTIRKLLADGVLRKAVSSTSY
jgi:hypothetical protein